MPKVNCAVIGCTTYQINKWTLEVASVKGTARTARNRLLSIASQVF